VAGVHIKPPELQGLLVLVVVELALVQELELLELPILAVVAGVGVQHHREVVVLVALEL
jgi:hypothetical protein